MALRVMKEGGVTLGGEHYPLKTRKKIERIEPREATETEPAVEGNIEDIEENLKKGYLIDTDAPDEPEAEPEPKTAKKGKGGK